MNRLCLRKLATNVWSMMLLLLLPALAIFATGNNTTTDLTNPTPIQEKNSPAEGRHVQIENSIQFGKHGRVIHSIAVMDEVHVQQKSQPTELYDNKRTTYAYDTLYWDKLTDRLYHTIIEMNLFF